MNNAPSALFPLAIETLFPPSKTDLGQAVPILGNTCEITLRFADFADFWQKSPVAARFALQAESRNLLKSERVKNCLRVRVSSNPVDVWHIPVTQSACFGNLQTCGSVWHCPVCAAKIASRRKEELSQAIDIWRDRGYGVLLATFTLRHTLKDNCADILTGVTEAFARFWQDRRGQQIRATYRVVGRVRGLETTFTRENGWHVHLHVLLFVRGVLPSGGVEQLRNECSDHWQAVLNRCGQYADGLHGVNIKSANADIADYVAKHGEDDMQAAVAKIRSWTEAHEMTLGVIKRKTNERGGFTPMQLLALSLCGDDLAGRLFEQYARAFKGKSQLYWSKGLRDLLGLAQVETDDEIAARQDETGTILAKLDSAEWKVILANAARGELLAAAATGDVDRLRTFFAGLGLNYVWIRDDVNLLG